MEVIHKKIHLLRIYLHEVTYYSKAHTNYSEFNRKTNKITSWISMICSISTGVIGVGAWNNLDSCSSRTNTGLIACTVVLSTIGSLIGGTRSQLRFGEKCSQHTQAANVYGGLAADIMIFLSGSLDDLDMISQFIDYVHGCVDTAGQTCPSVPLEYMNIAKLDTPFPKTNGIIHICSTNSAEIRRRRCESESRSNSRSNSPEIDSLG